MRAVTLMGMMPADSVHHVVALDGRFDSLERCRGDVDVRRIEGVAPRGGLLRRLKAMRAMLREHRDSLLLTYNWGSVEWLLAARRARPCGVVHHEDGFGPDEADGQLRRRVWIRRFALPVCDAVVVPSRNLFGMGRADWKQPESRLRYLPNGVDCGRFAPVDRSGHEELVFGCVGRVSVEKNVVLAVEAFARAECRTRTRLLVVGDGAELATCKARAAALGVAGRVDFAGSVADTAPQYRAMDIFLIPSKTEQMPLALLEAMASGLPVIGTAVGDVPQMVAAPNREWIDSGHLDPARLAASMDRLAQDPAARRALGDANRSSAVADFDLDVCYGAYVKTYLDAWRAGGGS